MSVKPFDSRAICAFATGSSVCVRVAAMVGRDEKEAAALSARGGVPDVELTV